MRASVRFLPLLALIASGSAAEIPEVETRLNVVVITLDTMRADALGVYGQELPTSPRIDAMAAGGVLFEQVVSSSPSTLPSHASLFTGKQPYAHGVRSNSGYRLSGENVTLAEVLRAAGYRTAAEIAAPVLGSARDLDQGFDSYRDPAATKSVVEHLDELESDSRKVRRNGEAITAKGLAFLRKNADRPFFLWLHYFDVHQPHEPPRIFLSRIPDSPYHAEVARVDYQVGRVLDQIEHLKLRDRTLVVLTADHGEGLGEHGEDTHSFFVYDTTVRVPLIFWGASVLPAGRRVQNLVRLVDVAPTIVDLLGLPVLSDVQGVSLAKLMAQRAPEFSVTGYGESIEPTVTFGSSVLRFVRESSWKYIHKLEPELFDVGTDPDEAQNLAGSHPEVVARLRGRLEELIRAAPAAPDTVVKISGESVAQLRALGYLGGDSPEHLSTELESLVPSGPDPASRGDDVQKLAIGFGYLKDKQPGVAEEIFSGIVERNPESPFPLSGLIRAVLAGKRAEAAIPLLRRGIDLDPERGVGYRLKLSRLLHERGEADEAEGLLRQALAIDPCAVGARMHLANWLHEKRDYQGQIQLLEAGDAACSGAVATRNALAYALATTPPAKLRDGARSLQIAVEVVRESRERHPGHLDTLACAYAEIGRFEQAQKQIERAIALFEGHAIPKEVRDNYDRHLAAVESRQPIRDP